MRALGYVFNLVARLLVSLVIASWGLVILGIGLRGGSGWWIAAGATIAIIGAIVLVGSPLVRRFLYDA